MRTKKGHARNKAKRRLFQKTEGYVGGYFIEACIAHYQLNGGKDTRMLDAAIRLADCWNDNIGPAPNKAWCDGHQEIEQALLRLASVVDEKDVTGAGKRFVALAKYLLDQRGGGDSYEQLHLPVIRQREALGTAAQDRSNAFSWRDSAEKVWQLHADL